MLRLRLQVGVTRNLWMPRYLAVGVVEHDLTFIFVIVVVVVVVVVVAAVDVVVAVVVV